MIELVFKGCLTALAAGLIMAVTVVVLAVIVYLIAAVISSLVQTCKEVQAENRMNKMLKAATKK